MTVFLQVLINGILFGTMYGIAALGLSLIFGTMRIIFLAQGATIVFFAYLSYWLFTLAGIDSYLGLLVVVPVALLVGVGLFYVLFKESVALEDKNVSLLLAVGLMYLLENLMLAFWSQNPRFIDLSYGDYTIVAGDIRVKLTRLLALVIAVAAASAVYVFLKKTRTGTAVRAAAENIRATTLLGINSYGVCAIAFGIGIGLAGVAGVVMGSVYSFNPSYGFVFSIKALIALTLGGIGNVGGALAAGVILGVIEAMAVFYIGSGWADPISYAVFILVLIFLPEGLFGQRRSVQKV